MDTVQGTLQKIEAPSLSIAILMFNEKENIASCLDNTLAFCKEHLLDFEIIVVDDGSTDSGADIVNSYINSEPAIRLFRHDRNRGMGAGMRTAIEHAQKDYFLYNAADGQISAFEISKMLPLTRTADIVLSTYSNRRKTMVREFISRAFRVYLRAVAGIRFEHEGLFLFPTVQAKQIAPHIQAETFFFCFELVQRGIEQGMTTAVTQIVCRDREHGSSKVVSLRRIVKVGREALCYGRNKRGRPPLLVTL